MRKKRKSYLERQADAISQAANAKIMQQFPSMMKWLIVGGCILIAIIAVMSLFWYIALKANF